MAMPVRVLLDSVVLVSLISFSCLTQHLNSLLDNYLEPLKKETFLSSDEIDALFGNIQEIVAFQRLFLHSLEEALAQEPDFQVFDQPHQFKVGAFAFQSGGFCFISLFVLFHRQNILFAVGNAFLYHAHHFKLYSSFCASHSKAQKVLLPSKSCCDPEMCLTVY